VWSDHDRVRADRWDGGSDGGGMVDKIKDKLSGS
jgi:hypothetical protein